MCVEWLVRCKVLPANHEATGPDAEVVHLAQSLRDGVLICHLLNVLSANCVDPKDFNSRPQMSQFLCLKNIRAFLQTCKITFAMRESDLFDSYDLFDMRNFGKVISTLSKLSKTPQAQAAVGSGFPPRNESVDIEHEYYNGLDLLVPEMENDTESIYRDPMEEEQDIYEDLCSCRAQQPSPTEEPKSKRDYCVKELVETEKNYVDALNMIMTHFMRPLRGIIPQGDRDVIFRHVEELAQIHTGFHSELYKACTIGLPKISDCFLKWKQKLLIYGDFCSHLPDAQAHIDEIGKNDTYQSHIMECQKKANDGKFRLRDLLSVPMQRVLKYHLLLKELLKQTDRDHEDRAGLEKALDAMHDLSTYVNEVKRDNESLKLLNEIQSSIIDLTWPENTSLRDYGRLQKDGELRVKSHDDPRSRTRYIFLLDRVMLMCKSKGEVYSYKNCLILANYKIDNAGNMLKTKGDKWNSPFLLVEKNNTTAITFYAKTDDMRDKWIENIKIALDNNQPDGYRRNNHDFVMHTFTQPTECNVCGRLLRGVFFQGYLCKNSQMAVHKECIKKADTATSLRNSVKPEPPPRPPVTSGSPHRLPQRPCIVKVKAIRSYRGTPPPPNGYKGLQFDPLDVLEVINREDSTWWEGRLHRQEGWFPSNNVREHRPGSGDFVVCNHSRSSSTASSQRLSNISSPATPPYVVSGGPRGDVPEGEVFYNLFRKSQHSYVNLHDLNGYSWFMGEMERTVATQYLDRHPSSTFLVRESCNPTRKGEYAISIKYGSSVKHIKVNRNNDQFFIADVKYFKSVPELIDFYQKNTLGESFKDLDSKLQIPFKESTAVAAGAGVIEDKNWSAAGKSNQIIGYAIASYDFAATKANHLSLQEGDRVAIISKQGEQRGWWKGMLDGKIGYFPCTYVHHEEDLPVMNNDEQL
ncbi:guanine nucleotide exchange factor VAV3-like isoform X2 [Tubulanus polymorphus]|uniref:guanine nucleotide exchange factor VAV3-like isoform X2 n=1 Tax=Tubulanus polymorphus TaxID=672921 RepID=UPI003DA29099